MAATRAIKSGISTVVNRAAMFGGSPLKPPSTAGAWVVGFPTRKLGGVVACSSSSTTKKPRGIMKPRPISPVLQELVGVPEMARTQVVKLIWAHIKLHNLQDPNDKKVIICDEKLKKIFGGKERVGFLEISGLITPHLL